MSTKSTVTRPKSIRNKMQGPEVSLGFTWGPANVVLMLAGIGLLGAGYISLAHGSLTGAPIMLVAGYCVVIPASLLVRGGGSETGE